MITQVPIAQAIVLCDGIHVDQSTGKFFLMGTFDSLRAASFPVTHNLMCVYVSLTDGLGLVNLKFQIVDIAEEREPFCVQEAQVQWSSPLQVVQHVYILQGVTFEEPGAYNLQVRSGDTLVIEKRLVVEQIGAKP